MLELQVRFADVFDIGMGARAVARENHWYSFQDLKVFALQVKELLDERDLNMSGLPVGILMRNRPTHFAACIASLLHGYSILTINPLIPAEPLERDIESLRPPVLVADEEDWDNSAFKRVCERVHGTVILMSGTPSLNLRVVQEAGKMAFREPAPGTAIEMLTSGTTGIPKRIKLDRLSLSRSLWSGSQYEASGNPQLVLKRSAGIQWMPLVHIGGLLQAIYSFYNARAFVLMERFDLERWHALILEYRPRFVNLPPSFMGQLLERGYPREDFSSLLALRTGAAPLDHRMAIEFEQRYDVPVLEGYGATEFAGGVAGWTIKDHRAFAATKRESVGRANPGVELRIVDVETGSVLAVNEVGLLEVRTQQIDAGKSWVRTTDLATLDSDGFLFLKGRADNAIIRGGFKVLPPAVEAALRSVANVAEACVVGVPDPRVGQVPVAAIEIRDATTYSEEDVQAALRTKLKPYEIPVKLLVVDKLPRTPSLKVSSAKVKELFS